MLKFNDSELAFDRAGQYQLAIDQYELALSHCRREKDCKIIRKNLEISRKDLWSKQYDEKQKREEAELKQKKAAAKQQVGKMLDELGSSWGRNNAGASGDGPTSLSFGPTKEKTIGRNTEQSGLTFYNPSQVKGPPNEATVTEMSDGLRSSETDDASNRPTKDTLEQLGDENQGLLAELKQPRNSNRTPPRGKVGKPGEDLQTTTHHGRSAATLSGEAAKQEAKKGFDTTGTGLAPLPTNVVDLRERAVNLPSEIPKDIGADIPTAKKQKVSDALKADPAWEKLKRARQAIEKKQVTIKSRRKSLQTELAKPLPPPKRKVVLEKIANTYVEEKAAGDELFDVKKTQKKVVEDVAKTVTVEIVDDIDSDPTIAIPDQSISAEAKELPSGENVTKQ